MILIRQFAYNEKSVAVVIEAYFGDHDKLYKR